jgi:predicted amidohydrolase
MTNKTITAGFVQFDVRLGDIRTNVKTVLRDLSVLADQGAHLAVLPEMWSCGFDNLNLVRHAERTPEVLAQICDQAIQYHMVIAGSLPERAGTKIFNTLYVTDADGSMSGAYRKVHLFSLTGEEKYFTGGQSNAVCQTAAGRLGLMICYDLRFPELCRALALKGAEIIIISAQWPQTRISRWDVLVRARAIENQVFVAAANRCGLENDTVFGGHSVIVDPEGNVLVEGGDQAWADSAEIDYDRMEAVRKVIPCFQERVPSAYET